MKLNIKLTSGLKFSTDFSGATVHEFKQHLTEEHSCAVPSQQRLVYKGRILDDGKKLSEDYEIVEGSTLFLVALKEPSAIATAAAGSTMTATTSPAATAAANNYIAPTTPAAPAVSTPTDINRLIQQMTQMQTQASSSPLPPGPAGTTAATAAADPLASLQSLMGDNPDFLANMMQSQLENNPALRRIMNENPMVREALSDPAALRQMMQTMTNQDYRAQQQRHHDLALANIENMPGGFNMLRNLYETVQVPMEEAATDVSRGGGGGGGNHRASSNNGTATPTASDATAGATNQAMPNPWGSPRPSTTNSALNRNATMANPLLGLGGGADPFGAGGNPFAASMGMMGPLGGGGGMQQPSREQQEAAITMLESNPALQQMLSASIRQNPAMLRQMMQQSASNSPAAAMMNNMSDEQLASMMEMATNPTAMRGIMRMQDLMQNNPNGMPNPMEMMALMGGGGGFGTMNNNNTNNPFFGGGAIPASLAHNPWAHPSSSPSASSPQPSAVRYARQLEQMRNMGFDDEAAALAALERANGNLNRAVDILLDSSSDGGGAVGGGGGDNTTTDT